MRAIGFDETVIFSTWTVLSVILQFGNCAFGSAEEAQMPDAPVLSKLSQALRCDPKTLGRALITKRIKAGGEWIETPNTAEVAVNIRDGCRLANKPSPVANEERRH